jgi:Domain of Unknown Function (DUF1080)
MRVDSPRSLFLASALSLVLTVGCKPAAEAPLPARPDELTAPAGPGTAPVGSAPSPSPATTEAMPEEPEEPFEIEEGFRELTLADFVTEPANVDTWTERNRRLISTGKPKGYLYTKDSFRNFTWRLEFRFPKPADGDAEADFQGNTGFLIYITGSPKIWPLCLEVQGKHAEMASIRPNGGAEAPEVLDDVEKRLAARSPIGEWNAVEIVSRDGALQVTLNGEPVVSSQPNFLSAGSIGIQAENHPFEVRRLRIRADE